MPTNVSTFEVEGTRLDECRIIDEALPEPAEGKALLRVDRFGYTANNITYAHAGDLIGYWQFFPAANGWGRIPVWGYADVVASRHDDLGEGERLYGCLPMATHLLINPDRVTQRDLTDASTHRRALPSAYNSYSLSTGDPFYEPERENETMLLFPLFFTGYLIDDQLGDNDLWGATTVIFSSASSKTAISAASLTHVRGAVTTVGLTSASNRALVESLGIYDLVVDYDNVDSLPKTPAVYVDMAGNPQVRAAVHEHYGDELRMSSMVGGTHGAAGFTADNSALAGPAPVFFFAPDQIRKRHNDWGRDELDQRVGDAWDTFLGWVATWFRIEVRRGADQVTAAHQQTLAGQVDPATGLVLSLHQ